MKSKYVCEADRIKRARRVELLRYVGWITLFWCVIWSLAGLKGN